MPTCNITITDHQAALVDRLVASGRFQDASEVLRYGLRLVEQREAEEAAKLERLRVAVVPAEAEAPAGRRVGMATEDDLDAAMASLGTE